MGIYYDYTSPDETVSDEKAIDNAIKNILLTRRGSMPGKPRFGSDLYKVVFEQIDHITVDLIKTFIIDAISEFEPRVNITNIKITDVPEFNRVTASITYGYNIEGNNITNTTTISLKD